MWVGAYHYQSPLAKLRYLSKNSQATLPQNSQPTRYPTQKLIKKPTTHKEVVSAQGAAVGATGGIGG
jgi:hypothetical protein